jgi:integrase/recombinase XerD
LPATILSTEEVDRVLELPDIAKPLGLRDRAILETLYGTGIRRLELTRLRCMDVDYARRIILVRKGRAAKTGSCPPANLCLRGSQPTATWPGHSL